MNTRVGTSYDRQRDKSARIPGKVGNERKPDAEEQGKDEENNYATDEMARAPSRTQEEKSILSRASFPISSTVICITLTRKNAKRCSEFIGTDTARKPTYTNPFKTFHAVT